MKKLKRSLLIGGSLALIFSLALFVALFFTAAPVGPSPLAFAIRCLAMLVLVPLLLVTLLVTICRIKE